MAQINYADMNLSLSVHKCPACGTYEMHVQVVFPIDRSAATVKRYCLKCYASEQLAKWQKEMNDSRLKK